MTPVHSNLADKLTPVASPVVIRVLEPRKALAPVLEQFSEPTRKRAERTLLTTLQRMREYDDLVAEQRRKQRDYDINERILNNLPGGANARTLEATEMRRRQSALDDELQGLESRIDGLERVLGWKS